MAPIEFTIDNLAFASSSLTASHKAAITNIARRLVEGSGGVSPIDEVQKIVLTGYASGTKNLEQHANRRAASVRKALEGCLRSFGAGPAQIAKIRLADPIVKKVATAAQSLGKDRKVVITILAGVAPERSTVDLDLAFVTQGDTRISIDNLDERFSPAGNHTKTEIYQLRAADLPKIFDKVALDDHGSYPRALKPDGRPNLQVENVSDVTDAQNVIRRLDPDVRLRNVFFLGHGSATEGFLFSGTPSGPGVLDAMIPSGPENRLMLSLRDAADPKFADDNKRILQALADRLARGYAGIWFLSCFTGAGELPEAVATLFAKKGRREFFVGAYRNFYQVDILGELRGTTSVSEKFGDREISNRVPRLRRFVSWDDKILDGSNHRRVLIRSEPNRVPRFEVLHGRGQFFIDFLRPLEGPRRPRRRSRRRP